jgi:hypothetical protein
VFPFGNASASPSPKSTTKAASGRTPQKAPPKSAKPLVPPAPRATPTTQARKAAPNAAPAKPSAKAGPKLSGEHAAILERATEALSAGPMFSEDLRSLFEDVPRSHYQAAMKQGVALGMVVKQGELRKTSYSLP